MDQVLFELDDVYSLIGIHASEEDYKLAFLINKQLKIQFKKHKLALDFKNSNAEYPFFEFEDDLHLIDHYLINNKSITLDSELNSGLFNENLSSISYLIPEKKEVDYFYKIQGCNNPKLLNRILTELKKINQIITCYLIDPNTLKSKKNLIF